MNTIEKEVKFLRVDFDTIQSQLLALGAVDGGEKTLRDDVYYFTEQKNFQRWCRIRQIGNEAWLCYKDRTQAHEIDTTEVEFKVEDPEKAAEFLKKCGLYLARAQEKKRHKFTYKNLVFDFDEWPGINGQPNPKFLEVEGLDEADMQTVCTSLTLDWENRIFGTSKDCLKQHFAIPIDDIKIYTFKDIQYKD